MKEINSHSPVDAATTRRNRLLAFIGRNPLVLSFVFIAVIASLIVVAQASSPRVGIRFSLSGSATDAGVAFNPPSDHPPHSNGSFLAPNKTLGDRIDAYANTPEANIVQKVGDNLDSKPDDPGTKDDHGRAGQFRTYCQYSHLNYDDPIVYPGKPGAAHLHMYFGNTRVDANSTNSSLVNTGGGTCEGYELNRTAYWMPATLDGNGKVVVPKSMVIYYKTADDYDLTKATKPMPQGLKMVAGNANSENRTPERTGIQWECYDGGTSWFYEGATIPDSCPPGITLSSIVYFRPCWDGVNLDSPDHKSHMADWVRENNKWKCPATHPVPLPQVSYHVYWTADTNYSKWHLSSDRHNGNNFPDGSTLHADWWGGWNKGIMNDWTNGCILNIWNCSNGILTFGKQLREIPTDYIGPNPLSL